LLALGFSVLGYISYIYPGAQADVTRALEDAFPSLIGEGDGQINIQDIIDSRANAGIIALLGLAYAGMGFLDALRDGLRRVFATSGREALLRQEEAHRRRGARAPGPRPARFRPRDEHGHRRRPPLRWTRWGSTRAPSPSRCSR
jgi:hypothetical protein